MAMLHVDQILLKNGRALGVKVELPKAPLVMIRAAKGFAVRVTGVKSFEDVLNAKVVNVSDEAKKLGIAEGITARDALELMF
jgi:uncharacterized protein YunC (DUF1805 family)